MKFGNIDRRLLTILLIVFVQMLGASMVFPILPLYTQEEFGMSPLAITLLISSFFAAQFVAGPTIGRLSDKYGRVPVLIISQIGTTISFLILVVANDVPTLFAARILDGITGGNIIVAQAYVTDIAPKEKRTAWLGFIFAAFGSGFIFGPAVGGILAASFGPLLPFVMAAIAAGATVVLTWITLDETLSPEQRAANRVKGKASLGPRHVLGNFPLLLILGIAFFGQFALGILQSTFALFGEAVIFQGYSEGATTLGIGLLISAIGVSQLITQTALLPRLVGRYNDALLVIIGGILRTIGMLVFAMAVGPGLAVIAMLIFPVGLGITMPALQTLTTNAVADEVRGGALGLYQSVVNMATIISTALAGALFSITYATPYWVGGILSALVLIPTFYLWQQYSPPSDKDLSDDNEVEGELTPAKT